MRILHIIARMNVGGTATYISNLISGLEKLGVENLLVMGNVPKGEAEDGVVATLKFKRIESLSRELSLTKDFRARSEIEAAVNEFKPDLIHTHTFKAGFLLRIGKRQIPVIHSFHGHHLYDPEFGLVKRSILNLVERFLAPRAQRLVTIGKKVGQELLAVGIGKPEQYLSIPPGIAPIELGSNSAIRKKFGFREDEVLILWLGRFTQVKRPDRVIELARLMPQVRFLMAGGGEMLEELKQRAPSNLTFLGYQDKNQMWTIADIALCTSDSEGMPLSLIEAQMAGVPVVSTDVGSVAEIVEDGVTGRLAMRSVADLVAKLIEVIGEIEKSDALSKASQRRAAREFSVKVMAEAHLDIYKRVLDKVTR